MKIGMFIIGERFFRFVIFVLNLVLEMFGLWMWFDEDRFNCFYRIYRILFGINFEK